MKEIYYIRDRVTKKIVARLEKEDDYYTAYRLTDDYRPFVWFKIHGKRDVCPNEDIQLWLNNRVFPQRRENIDEILRQMNIPYWDPWLIFKGISGRSTDDEYELLDENLNYTFSF